MPGHRDDIECVVFVLIEQFGGAAVHFARAQPETAVPNTLSARTWNEIADAIARLKPRQHASRHPRGRYFMR
jgi:hypothetical protein